VNKTDVIDAELLSQCEDVLGVRPAPLVRPEVLGLRRALARRHKLTVEAHWAEWRLWGLSSWAFPDLWRACGGHRLAQPVLGRWPDLAGLARAHLSSICEVVAAHSRDRDAARRAATQRAVTLWRAQWPDDPLTSVPGVGEICASSTRAWWDHGRQLPDAKAAAAFIGLNPSNWESGISASPSRPITKEGPPALRLAYYQAANVARRHDPGLAWHYRKLVVERRHNRISANCAVARKLAARTWVVLHTGQPYQLRDLGTPIDWATATELAASMAGPTRNDLEPDSSSPGGDDSPPNPLHARAIRPTTRSDRPTTTSARIGPTFTRRPPMPCELGPLDST
jgi:transposase